LQRVRGLDRAFGGSAYTALVMPPSRLNMVQPYWRVMSHRRDLAKRRLMTPGRLTSAAPVRIAEITTLRSVRSAAGGR
jgi:hypothetical protein